MLESTVWILGMGFFGGQIAWRLRVPALVGMMGVGLVLGPYGSGVIAPAILENAGFLRAIAVMAILMKAGLGLDREKLAQQGTVVLRLGFLPAACEVIAVAIAAKVFLSLAWPIGLLLGCILGAESPAVIVPGMLRLKSLGWGVAKGIPDAILTGSALSNVLLLLVFSLLLAFLGKGAPPALPLLLLQVVLQIGLGIGLGWLAAKLLASLLTQQNWTQNAVQDMVVAASLALFLVVAAEQFPWFSGYMAVMALGFFLVERDAPLARRLREGFDGLWTIAEIVLFVLLGASIQLAVLGRTLLPGLAVLAIGTLLGRGLGWYLSTLGSNWTPRERLFLLAGHSAKATVQAAIGAIPLSRGVPGGDTILALAVLSILVTAPLGAWAIPTFAPKLLTQGEVDPTKVAVSRPVVLLAAVDTSPLATAVLTKVADLARRSDGEVVVLHVLQKEDPAGLAYLQQKSQRLLADIRYRLLTTVGNTPAEILQVAQEWNATEIVLGKRGHRNVLVGSVSQTVLETSPIPVVVVAAEA
ncbi:MAG: cation:proton antiporter [Pseudanabaenaceae cyanobacterium]